MGVCCSVYILSILLGAGQGISTEIFGSDDVFLTDDHITGSKMQCKSIYIFRNTDASQLVFWKLVTNDS